MFTIQSIKIYPECQHLKNLHPSIYELGETEDKEFLVRKSASMRWWVKMVAVSLLCLI